MSDNSDQFPCRVVTFLILCCGHCGMTEGQRAVYYKSQGKNCTCATTTRLKLAFGTLRNSWTGSGQQPRNPFPEKSWRSHCGVLAMFLGHYPWDSQLRGRWCQVAWQVFPLPGSSRSESVPGHQTVLPASPFMKAVPGWAS